MDIEIPVEARAAGWTEFEAATRDRAWLSQAYARALEAAAPLIVAAELERLAEEVRAEAADPHNDWRPNETYRAQKIFAKLRHRATELRDTQPSKEDA